MKQKQKNIAVCVLAYNQEKYIEQCLNGIINQQGDFKLSVLIGEDESSDNTRRICRKYAEKFPDTITLFERSRKDVIYIDGKATGRYNFIQTIAEAKSEYLAICEGDDFWTDPFKLALQIETLENDKTASAVFHNVEYFNEEQNKRWLFHPDGWKKRSGTKDLCIKNFIATTSIVFRVPENGLIFPQWYNQFRAGDWALHLMNSLRGDIIYIDRVMGVYRKNPGSTWSAASRPDQLKSVLNMYDFLLKTDEFISFRKELNEGKSAIEKEIRNLQKNKESGFMYYLKKMKKLGGNK